MGESMKIAWDDVLNTGDHSVDLQHRFLVNTINELADAIESGGGKTALGEILVVTQYYTEWHFEQEEELMEKYACPVAETNKRQHAYFIDAFKKYRSEFRTQGGSNDLARTIYKELTDWLVNHIMKTDKQLADFIPHSS